MFIVQAPGLSHLYGASVKKKFYNIGGKTAAEAEGEAEEAAAGREEGRLLHLRQEVQATERPLPPRQPCSP